MISFSLATSTLLHGFRWLTPHFEENYNVYLIPSCWKQMNLKFSLTCMPIFIQRIISDGKPNFISICLFLIFTFCYRKYLKKTFSIWFNFAVKSNKNKRKKIMFPVACVHCISPTKFVLSFFFSDVYICI